MLIQEPVIVLKSFRILKSVEQLVEEVVHKLTRATCRPPLLTFFLWNVLLHASKIVLVLSKPQYLEVVKLRATQLLSDCTPPARLVLPLHFLTLEHLIWNIFIIESDKVACCVCEHGIPELLVIASGLLFNSHLNFLLVNLTDQVFRVKLRIKLSSGNCFFNVGKSSLFVYRESTNEQSYSE